MCPAGAGLPIQQADRPHAGDCGQPETAHPKGVLFIQQVVGASSACLAWQY
jgi:hypothetical protein